MDKMERIDVELSRIIADLERLLGKTIATSCSESEYLTAWGLTTDETKAWLGQEPDFTRRNFTPLDTRRRLYRA